MAGKCLRSLIPVLDSQRSIQFYDYGTEISNPNPTVLYVPGFQGNGHGLKSQEMIKHCQMKGIRYVCYDPEGLGESKVTDWASMRFQHWFEDAQAAIKHCKSEQIILVGSSMGGWISLKMANTNPDVIKALVLIAPAVNFLRPMYENWYKNVATPEQKKEQDDGKLTLMDPSYNVIPVSKVFVEESINMELDTSTTLDIKCPVKILHGIQDDTIPYENSLKVMKMIRNEDVELIYQKSGDHRMQSDSGLELILRSLDDTLSKLK